ncbi:MAG: O-antigen ligase family protein [Actinomycetota bacterium]
MDRSLLSQPKIRLLVASSVGLMLLWFVPGLKQSHPLVPGAPLPPVPKGDVAMMLVWLVVAGVLYWKARGDDWLMLPIVGLPFWWATGLFQYVIPILAGVAVLGALLAPPVSGRFVQTWRELGVEKWLAFAAFLVMLPSALVVSGAGRYFTYFRTLGLIGASLAAFLLAITIVRKIDPKPLLHTLLAFAGLVGIWTLCQLIFKGSIRLPLQTTARIMTALGGHAGAIASRDVAEIAGIKYEKIGLTKQVIRPHAFFIHSVVTGAIAGLFAPMLWRRIRHKPIQTAIFAGVFSGLIGAAIVASLARGAYIGVFGSIIGAVIVFWKRLRTVDWKKAWPSLVLGAIVLAGVVLPLFSNAKAREESQVGASSYTSRQVYYRATLKAIPEYLLFGHGTQRANLAAPLYVGNTPIKTLPDGDQIARTTHLSFGCTQQDQCLLLFRKVEHTEKTLLGTTVHKGDTVKDYFLKDGKTVGFETLDPLDRDPPLGSHSTILGIGYKFGVLGMLAFIALWLFIGLKPLRILRISNHPLAPEARALWIGILAFGLQLPIYEYDYDSTSPYLFYLISGILLGIAVVIARSSSESERESRQELPVG